MIRMTTKTTICPPTDSGNITMIKQRRISGLCETGIIFLGLYGGYMLIKNLFSKKEEKPEEETE